MRRNKFYHIFIICFLAFVANSQNMGICFIHAPGSPIGTGIISASNGVPHPPVAAALNPLFSAKGDFNNDGMLDLAVANAYASKIYVYLGTGGGNFSATFFSSCNTGTFPNSVVAADLNGDGNLDLVTTTSSFGVMYSLKGDGTGHFVPYSQSHSTQGGTGFGKLADFNNDGKMDFVAGDIFGNRLAIFIGNGLGSFSLPTYYTVGNLCSSVITGDFNGDGYQDIASTSLSSGSVAVLLGSASGIFGATTYYTVAATANPTNSNTWFYSYWEPEVMASGDFDQDGHIDLAVSNLVPNNVSILLGNGSGGFGSPTNIALPANHMAGVILVNDMNADGKLDIIIGNEIGNDISVFLGNGGTSFNAPISFVSGSNNQYALNYPNTPYLYAGSQSIAMVAGDYNNDGRMDLAVNNYNDGTTTILLNNLTSSINATPPTICLGNSGTLNTTASGTGTISYLWNTAAITSSITLSPALTTTYTCTTTNGQCSLTNTVQVTINPLPTAFTVNSATINCYNQTSATLNVSVSKVINNGRNTNPIDNPSVMSNNIVYTWAPATGLNTTTGTSVIANPTSTTTYTITATNSFGCTYTTTTTVTVKALTTSDAQFNITVGGHIPNTNVNEIDATANTPIGLSSSWNIKGVIPPGYVTSGTILPSLTISYPTNPSPGYNGYPPLAFPGYSSDPNYAMNPNLQLPSPGRFTFGAESYTIIHSVWSTACPIKVNYTWAYCFCTRLENPNTNALDSLNITTPTIFENMTNINSSYNSSDNFITVYPNPTNNLINIESENSLGVIIIYNVLGEIVYQSNSKNTKEQIEMSKLPTGIYTIVAKDTHVKLIKE